MQNGYWRSKMASTETNKEECMGYFRYLGFQFWSFKYIVVVDILSDQQYEYVYFISYEELLGFSFSCFPYELICPSCNCKHTACLSPNLLYPQSILTLLNSSRQDSLHFPHPSRPKACISFTLLGPQPTFRLTV
jgi:hypothetical protein